MTTPTLETTASPGKDIYTRLESVAKIGGVFLATLYGLGFLIVSLHHAQFGVSDFSLIKPRALFAGFLFLFLTAVPAVAGVRFYSAIDWQKIRSLAREVPNETSAKLGLMFLFGSAFLSLYQAAIGLVWLSDGLFSQHRNRFPLAVIFGGVAIVIVLSKARNITPLRYQFWVFLAWSCGTALSGFLLWKFAGDRQFALSIWYFACTAIAFLFLVLKSATKLNFFATFEWEQILLLFPGVIWMFAHSFYGEVMAEFGGGAPTAITIHLNKDGISAMDDGNGGYLLEPTKRLATTLPNDRYSGWLVEETDSGAYVMKEHDYSSAIFVPKSVIVLLEPNRALEWDWESGRAK